MRVCFVNPPVRRVVELDYDAPRYPSETLAILAAYCRAKGHSCTVIDAKRERLDEDATLARVLAAKPEAAAFTSFTHEIAIAGKLAADLKRQAPGCVTVIGGYHATPLPRETLSEFPGFDYAVAGEGELPLTALLGVLAADSDLAGIPGLAFRRGTDIIANPPGAAIADLNALPMPAFDLLPPSKVYVLTTARGCPFTCPFCLNLHGTKVRHRDPLAMAALVRELCDRYQPDEIMFGNENFLLAGTRPQIFLEELIRLCVPQRLRWQAQTHVSTATPELLALMKAAGAYRICLGIESGDDDMLARIGKGITREQSRNAVRAAQKAGLEVELNIILGLPGETAASAQATLNFLAELNPTLAAIGLMVPYPGTAVADFASRGEHGYRLLSHDWSDYNKQLGRALELGGLPRRALENLQLRGYLGVYLKNRRYTDLLRFAWRYRREALAFLANHLCPHRG